MARRALLIGAKTLGLQFADRDAEHMRMALEQHGYEVAIIEPIRSVINNNLDKLVDEVGQTDTVIIYFSGHAVLDNGLRLVLQDTYQSRSGRFEVDDIIKALNECRTKQKVLILDCCHANAGTQDWNLDLSESFSILTASGRLEKAKEIDSLQGSFLTHHFVCILNRAQDYVEHDIMYLHTIYDAIDAAALDYNREHPDEMVPRPSLLGNRQHTLAIAHLVGQQPTTPLVRWEREYRRLLLESCDILDLANLPQDDRHLATRRLELRRLYVPLRVYSEEHEQRHPEFVEETLKRFEQQRDYWNRHISSPPTKRMSIGKHLNDNQRIVILGDPGAGKSTLLRWITTAFLLRYEQNDDWQQLPDVMDLPHHRWLPVLIRCRELSKACIDGTLTDILRHTLRLRELGQEGIAQVLLLIKQQLEAGTALLLIDGLDEISTAKERSLFCRQLERIVAKYPAIPMIVTSRIVGYREMGIRIGHNFSHVTVADLTKEDKDLFAQCWCDLTELPERKQKAAEELIAQIHGHDRIERLTNNPMLLTTMALIKRKIGRLPQRRIELYSEAVKVLLNWRSEVDEPLDSHEAEPQLQYIAYAMAERGVQQLREDEILVLIEQMRQEYSNLHALNRHTPHEFLRLLEGRTGLLFEAGTTKHKGRLVPVYEFRHLTFQEYLAGMALVEGRYPACNTHQLMQKVGMIAGFIEKKGNAKESVVSERWREAIRLAVAAWNDNDVDQLLMTIIQPGDCDSLEERRARLIMACQCLADEPNASDNVVQNIIRAIARVFEHHDIDGLYSTLTHSMIDLSTTRWNNITYQTLLDEYLIYPKIYIGLLISKLSRIFDKDREWFDEKILILRENMDIIAFYEISEYIQYSSSDFLRKSRIKDIEYIINKALFNELPFSMAAVVLILGISERKLFTILSSSIIDILYSYIENESYHYSLKVYSLNLLSLYWDERMYSVFEECLKSDVGIIRSTAIMALSRLEYDGIDHLLIPYLDDTDPLVRINIINALAKYDSKNSLNLLLSYLDDRDIDVRQNATEALGLLGDTRAIESLLICLGDSNVGVRRGAITALAHLRDGQVIESLLICLEDSDVYVRQGAITALGQIGDVRAVEPLLDCLEDSNIGVRRDAITALGQIGDIRSIEFLRIAVNDSDTDVRRNAIYALLNLGDESVIDLLLEDINNCNISDFWGISPAIMLADDGRVVTSLINRLELAKENQIFTIVYHLGRIHDERVVAPLLSALEDFPSASSTIVSRLGYLEDIRALEKLLVFLSENHDDFLLLIRAINALGQIGDVRAVEPLIELLSGSEPTVLANSAQALGQIGDVRAVEPLIKLLSDTRVMVRSSSISALGQLEDLRAVGPLLLLFGDTRAAILSCLARALGKLGSDLVIEPLLVLLSDSREDVRVSVVEAFGNLGDIRLVDPLLCLLEQENRMVVCTTIANSLRQLGNQQGSEILFSYLSKPQIKYRQEALELLSQNFDDIDKKLLSRDIDSYFPIIDPQRVITERRVKNAAWKLRLEESSIRLRYERLAVELGLNLGWEM